MAKDIFLLAIAAAFALGTSLTSLALPSYAPDLPYWVSHWWFWGGLALMGAMILNALLLYSWWEKPGPVARWFSAANLGYIVIASALIAYFSGQRLDQEFMYVKAHIRDPLDKTAPQLWIFNNSLSPFNAVTVQISPLSANRNSYDKQYWSLNHFKRAWPAVIHGLSRYDAELGVGDYQIEIDATQNNVSYHFDQILIIREVRGQLIQVYDVWKIKGRDGRKLVHSSPDRPPIFSRPLN